jgi:hypothetical protein
MANLAKLVEVAPEAVQSLEAKLRARETSLPEKYRVLFSLRNIDGKGAHDALALGAANGRRGSAPRCSLYLSLPVASRRRSNVHSAMHLTFSQPCATAQRCFGMTWRSAWGSGRTRQQWRCCRQSWPTRLSTPCEDAAACAIMRVPP